MANKKGIDLHRTALALMQASKAEDTEGSFALLRMVQGPDADEFLIILAAMVHYAFTCDPAEGWDAFMKRYAADIDAAEVNPA